MLAELAAVYEPRRVGLVVGWWPAGRSDFEWIVRDGIAPGDDHSDDDLAAIATSQAELQRYAASRGANARRAPGEKDLARTHARAREYLDFRLTHHFVHESAMAAERLQTKRSDGTHVVGGPGADIATRAPPAGAVRSDVATTRKQGGVSHLRLARATGARRLAP